MLDDGTTTIDRWNESGDGSIRQALPTIHLLAGQVVNGQTFEPINGVKSEADAVALASPAAATTIGELVDAVATAEAAAKGKP